MPDSTEQAPTVIGSATETEIVGPVEYPETPKAWSAPEGEWCIPTQRYRRPRRNMWPWLAPAAIIVVVGVTAVALGGRESQPKPHPAPPSAVVPAWTPDSVSDAKYSQAIKDAGWVVENQQIDLNHAHWSCTYLSQGHTMKELVEYWDQQPYAGETPIQNHDDDVQWTGIIVTNMCPQYR